MIQMLPKLLIPVSSCCDVKISLDLVALQASVDTTGIWRLASAHPGGLAELPLGAPQFPQHMADVGIFLQFPAHGAAL